MKNRSLYVIVIILLSLTPLRFAFVVFCPLIFAMTERIICMGGG